MKKYCVDLEIAGGLKESGFPQNSNFNYINSSYNTGFEGESIYWLCDNVWRLHDLIPNPEYHDTAKITKEQGLIPDFCHKDYNKFQDYRKLAKDKISKLKVCSAPISDEILKELPNFITENGTIYYLNIFRDTYTAIYAENTENYYEISYVTHGSKCLSSPNNICMEADKLSNALAKMWIYLKKEGLIK